MKKDAINKNVISSENQPKIWTYRNKNYIIEKDKENKKIETSPIAFGMNSVEMTHQYNSELKCSRTHVRISKR